MVYSKSYMLLLTTEDIQLIYNLLQVRMNELSIIEENPKIIATYRSLLEKVKG